VGGGLFGKTDNDGEARRIFHRLYNSIMDCGDLKESFVWVYAIQ